MNLGSGNIGRQIGTYKIIRTFIYLLIRYLGPIKNGINV